MYLSSIKKLFDFVINNHTIFYNVLLVYQQIIIISFITLKLDEEHQQH